MVSGAENLHETCPSLHLIRGQARTLQHPCAICNQSEQPVCKLAAPSSATMPKLCLCRVAQGHKALAAMLRPSCRPSSRCGKRSHWIGTTLYRWILVRLVHVGASQCDEGCTLLSTPR